MLATIARLISAARAIYQRAGQPPDPIEAEGWIAHDDGMTERDCPYARQDTAARWLRGLGLARAAERAW